MVRRGVAFFTGRIAGCRAAFGTAYPGWAGGAEGRRRRLLRQTGSRVEPTVLVRQLYRRALPAVLGMAIGMLTQPGSHALHVPRAEPPPSPAAVAAGPPASGAWALRINGWYIQVDGRSIAEPSSSPQGARQPRATFAWSISPFDRLIVHHAKEEGFDWRLIAALIFEESRFNPTSQSTRGAYGLMQVRPIAAEAVGARRFKAPDDNVRTGIRYLRQLDDAFSGAAGRDRLCLVLAAYNMGPGHVRDAQQVARHLGLDPNRWRGAMDVVLPLLEDPTVYTQLPNGYAQGRETVRYVRRILKRYDRYRRATAVLPAVDGDALSSSLPGASTNNG